MSDCPHKESDSDTYVLFVNTYVVDEGVFSEQFLAEFYSLNCLRLC